MSLERLYAVLLISGLALLASIVTVRIASRAGLPSLLVFLGVGVALGEDGIGIQFDNDQLAQTLGTAALGIILVEGGLNTRWGDIRRVLAPATVLSTIGVLISAGITAVGAHLLLGTSWQLALLLGAIVASTDAAAVFSVLRALPLPRRLAGLLEAESGFNDAPTVILVLLLSTTAATALNPAAIAGQVAYELVVGGAIGVVVGVLGAWALARIALPASGLYPLSVVGLGIVAFAAAGVAHASGFLAAYLAGLVLGNTGLPHRAATRSFAEGAGWLAQIGLFILLGLLVTPHELPAAIVPALVVGLVLLLLARPASVIASISWFRVPWREQVFLSWAGLRGAVPIVLATIPVVKGVPGSELIFNIVFVLVVAFTLVQGPSLPMFARKLGLTHPEAAREVQVESAPLDTLNADMLTVAVPPGSRLHGVSVLELRLPYPSIITMIVRDGKTFVPERFTTLRTGDELLIVTTAAVRDAAERRLRAVGRRGKLARWFGENGTLD